ncbi:hypothetical protein M422DRAFT_271784 [Sphaerobolus stellatus SS14]|uniref:Uncharacterized protein n=1 Tax=Sphaerobolus stellatus (strain SS14) TaxID=990650 RepID=A0A0C9UP60_SPHS4|nr:hypothetical protein M422DRAFT_271784 [Sphaerobolus stellatus SS14]
MVGDSIEGLHIQSSPFMPNIGEIVEALPCFKSLKMLIIDGDRPETSFDNIVAPLETLSMRFTPDTCHSLTSALENPTWLPTLKAVRMYQETNPLRETPRPNPEDTLEQSLQSVCAARDIQLAWTSDWQYSTYFQD